MRRLLVGVGVLQVAARETEILLAYGGISFASRMGQLAGNHFITLTSGLENLMTLGNSVLWKGAHDIRFEFV